MCIAKKLDLTKKDWEFNGFYSNLNQKISSMIKQIDILLEDPAFADDTLEFGLKMEKQFHLLFNEEETKKISLPKKKLYKKSSFLFNHKQFKAKVLYNLARNKTIKIKAFDKKGIPLTSYTLSSLLSSYMHIGHLKRYTNDYWKPILVGNYYNTSLINLNYTLSSLKFIVSIITKIYSSFTNFWNRLFIFDYEISYPMLQKFGCFFNNHYYYNNWTYGSLTNFKLVFNKTMQISSGWGYKRQPRSFIYGFPIMGIFGGFRPQTYEYIIREFSLFKIPTFALTDTDNSGFFLDYPIISNTKILLPRYFFFLLLYKNLKLIQFIINTKLMKNFYLTLFTLKNIKKKNFKLFKLKLRIKKNITQIFSFIKFNHFFKIKEKNLKPNLLGKSVYRFKHKVQWLSQLYLRDFRRRMLHIHWVVRSPRLIPNFTWRSFNKHRNLFIKKKRRKYFRLYFKQLKFLKEYSFAKMHNLRYKLWYLKGWHKFYSYKNKKLNIKNKVLSILNLKKKFLSYLKYKKIKSLTSFSIIIKLIKFYIKVRCYREYLKNLKNINFDILNKYILEPQKKNTSWVNKNNNWKNRKFFKRKNWKSNSKLRRQKNYNIRTVIYKDPNLLKKRKLFFKRFNFVAKLIQNLGVNYNLSNKNIKFIKNKYKNWDKLINTDKKKFKSFIKGKNKLFLQKNLKIKPLHMGISLKRKINLKYSDNIDIFKC